MKKLVFMVIALSSALAFAAGKLNPEERKALSYARTGGMLVRPVASKVVKIVNAANLPEATINALSESIRTSIRLPISVTAGSDDPQSAFDQNTGFVLVLSASKGPRILTAPEDGWARVSVGELATDDSELFDARVRKEAWRALAYGLGAGHSKFHQCIMKPMTSVADLDANRSLMACPEAYTEMCATAVKRGIKPTQLTTYRKACEEGWAPAPTNEYQKVIWDKTHEIPSEPLKIQFDPAKKQ